MKTRLEHRRNAAAVLLQCTYGFTANTGSIRFFETSRSLSKSVIDCYSPVALDFMIRDAGLVCCHRYLRLLAVIFNPTKLLSGPFV